jgi:metallo-beta-lactamase family protein
VLMPVNAIGHAQEIIQVLTGLVATGVLHNPRIYLDSPRAAEVTETYARHLELVDPEASRVFSPSTMPEAPLVNFIETAADSRELLRGGPAIILAGYGMCESGRIQDHLTLHIDDPQSCVIFTGYQVEGTLGRMLMDGAPHVQIHGKTLPVKAQIYTSYELSGQADQADLLEWVGGFNAEPSVFLVHGEVPQMMALAEALRGQYGIRAVLPQWREMTLFSSP